MPTHIDPEDDHRFNLQRPDGGFTHIKPIRLYGDRTDFEVVRGEPKHQSDFAATEAEMQGLKNIVNAGIHTLDTRLTREDFYMEVARLCAKRSTCLRGNVGCVIVKDRRIIGMGYNGAPAGMPQCDEVGCQPNTRLWKEGTNPSRPDTSIPLGKALDKYGCQRTIHDVANAIAYAARAGVSVQQATIFATHSPCHTCAQLAVAAGIHRFVYENPYRAEDLQTMLDARIIVQQHEWTPIG